MSVTAAIYGFAGTEITPEEKAFFRDADPWGFVLFARNIDRPRQVARLAGSLRDMMGRDVPILIDQEGGRVQRLKPPTWRKAPPARRFGELYEREPELGIEAVRLNHEMLAHELITLGIDVDAAPCCDLVVEGADAVIGDRAFSPDPQTVGVLALAALEGLHRQGVAGIVKHSPGHGRADADSHFELPVVREEHGLLSETDFAPFRAVAGAEMAMTAHVVYADIDEEHCATLSREVISNVIRTEIGFDGLLMSDDLSMKALRGTIRQRGEGALKAGCDMLLHCNGDMKEMIEVAHAAVRLDGKAAERAQKAGAARGRPAGLDLEDARRRLDAYFREAGLEALAG